MSHKSAPAARLKLYRSEVVLGRQPFRGNRATLSIANLSGFVDTSGFEDDFLLIVADDELKPCAARWISRGEFVSR